MVFTSFTRLRRRQHHHDPAAGRHRRARRLAVARQEGRHAPSKGGTAATVAKRRGRQDRHRRCEARRRRAHAHRTRHRHADARSGQHLRAEGQHPAHRHQRIRRLRRPDRRERRARAECGFVLLQGVRLQGRDLDERGRNLVAAQQRPARGHRHHHRCAGRARPSVRCRRAGADRLLARRRHGGRGQRHRLGQQTRRQDAGGLAVQRERVLHPLSRAGSRRAGDRAARSRFETGRRLARPRVLRRRVHRLRCLST